MNKYSIIGGSILAVVLLVFGSMNSIVGYQTNQLTNQKIINSEVNPKELLFQMILDLTNNREIQKSILESETTGKRFFDPGARFSVFPSFIFTEMFLKQAYSMGVILTKTNSKSRLHSILKHYQMNNQGVQKKITSIIEKDAALKGKMTQLSCLSCDCGDQSTISWSFPIICTFLYIWYLFSIFLMDINIFAHSLLIDLIDVIIMYITGSLAYLFGCSWIPYIS